MATLLANQLSIKHFSSCTALTHHSLYTRSNSWKSKNKTHTFACKSVITVGGVVSLFQSVGSAMKSHPLQVSLLQHSGQVCNILTNPTTDQTVNRPYQKLCQSEPKRQQRLHPLHKRSICDNLPYRSESFPKRGFLELLFPWEALLLQGHQRSHLGMLKFR